MNLLFNYKIFFILSNDIYLIDDITLIKYMYIYFNSAVLYSLLIL